MSRSRAVAIGLIIVMFLLTSFAQALAATMKFRLVLFHKNVQSIPVVDVEGHIMAVAELTGLASLATGEVAVITLSAFADYIKGTGTAEGYTRLSFEDGSSIAYKYQHTTEAQPDGKISFFKSTAVEIIQGTGKYAGIRGEGSFTGKRIAPLGAGAQLYVDVTLTYTLPSGALRYDPGVSDTEIKIGNTIPYSGPASAYGTIGRAAEAYFGKINDEGGINGRKIRFISYDDAYSAARTVEQVRRLVEQDGVLLLFQTLGTPPNTAIWEYVNREKVPHIFISTGATKWGDPMGHPWTMGFQPNYQSEGQIYAQYVLRHLPNAKIGILYQDDDFGRDYLKGFKDGLGYSAANLIVSEQTYRVSDQTVEPQIDNLKQNGADVFFNVCIPKFAIQAIKKAADIGWKPIHLITNVSNSVGSVLKPAGFEASTGLISCFYMKDPDDPQWQDDPAVKEFRTWLKRYYPEGSAHDTLNVNGYTAAQALVHVLERCGEDLTRENVMKQAANMRSLELPMLLPGIKIDTSPSDFYPLQQLQLARFDGERWVLFGDVLEAAVK